MSIAIVRRFAPVALALPMACGRGAPVPSHRLLIRNVTVISPGTPRLDRATVVIVGDRIAEVGQAITAAAGDSVIDGAGRFLIPGLIDGHVHLAQPVGIPFPTPNELQQAVAAYFVQLPRSYLYHGFTTVVDLNVVDRGALDRFKQAPDHPDLYDCGPGMPLRDGYPMMMTPAEGRYARFPNYVVEPNQPGKAVDSSDHSPRAGVERVKAAGGICVKTFFEDGFGDEINDWPVPSAGLMNEVRQEATANNLVMAMHANSARAWRFAADTRVDLIVHGMWNWIGFGRPLATLYRQRFGKPSIP